MKKIEEIVNSKSEVCYCRYKPNDDIYSFFYVILWLHAISEVKVFILLDLIFLYLQININDLNVISRSTIRNEFIYH